jgi:2'-5' RNA ligase
MNSNPAKLIPDAPIGGLFALVTYLPEPLGSFLTGLRHLLPGETRPEAHITFLPPRPLTVSPESASYEIQRILRTIRPFEVALGSVRIFPETGIMYLSVESGRTEALHLHASLNSGKLHATENFEYIPHLTLGGPLELERRAEILHRAQQEWKAAGFSPTFRVTETVLLCQSVEVAERDWTRIATLPLSAQVIQTSGVGVPSAIQSFDVPQH